MLTSLTNRVLQHRDAPVWHVLREPRFKPHHVQSNFTTYTDIELPYSLEELAEKTHRSRRSVRASVHRLEKRGKVKEVHGGWQRKEK